MDAGVLTNLVGVGLALGMELVDGARADLEVLSKVRQLLSRAVVVEKEMLANLVGSELLLLGLGALLAGLGRTLGSLLLLLGSLLLAGLLALLELRLGDHLARDLVEVQLANSLSGLVAGGGLLVVGHGWYRAG